MKASVSISIFLMLWLSFSLHADDPVSLSTAFKAHCLKCHGESDEVEGDVNLLSLSTESDLRSQPELLENIISVLNDREMPPEDEPELPDELRQQMISQLRHHFKESLKTLPFEPTPMRRMNRFQYNNAVVDLLGLDRDLFQLNERLLRRRENYFRPATKKMPDKVKVSSRPLSKDIDNQRPEGFRGVAAFPQDQRAEHGFDNRADHITLSPLLMESFLQLSQSVAESPDLNPEECRRWNEVFAEPVADPDRDVTKQLRARLGKLLRRAFRRPVEEATLDRFTEFASGHLSDGATFEQAMRNTIGVILGMPDFLYLYESDSATVTPTTSKSVTLATNPGRQPVSNHELATRLAQFFWSSIPDDELLDLAEAGSLRRPETLSAQIDRMMIDSRSSRFCDNFPGQWLQLDRLVTSIPDREKFAYFYYRGYRSSMHMMSEPLLLFEAVYIEDRSIMDLIDPDFTYENEMLKANYAGRSDVDEQLQVQTFHRVSLDDPRRGGVITNAAIMTMTSSPTRTEPITRGAWVNAVIFNDPPEPPPADVPPLPEPDHEELAKLTIRERLAVHRERADCAGCHDKIDPFGFALENYDPVGVWRDKYENGRDVDTSGRLFNQYEFETVIEFKHLIVQEKPRFVRAFIAHLLSYALGRELGPADSVALDEMTGQAVDDGDSMRAVLKRIAMSEPFLHKNPTSPEHADAPKETER